MSQQLVWLGCLVNAALAGAEQGAAAAASATSRHGEVSFTGSDVVDIPSVATLRDVVFGGKEVWIIGFYLPTRCPACVSMGAEMKSAAAVLRGTGIRFGAINALAPGLEQLPSDFGAWPLTLPKKNPRNRNEQDTGTMRLVTIDLQQKLAGRSGIVGTATALRGNVLHDNLVTEAKLLLQQRSPDDLALLTTADRGVDHWRWTPKFVAAVKAVRTGDLPLLLDRTDVVKELGSLFLDEPLTKRIVGPLALLISLYLLATCWLQRFLRVEQQQMNAAQRAQVDEQAASFAAQVAEKREQEAGKMARQQQREREGQQRAAVEVTRRKQAAAAKAKAAVEAQQNAEFNVRVYCVAKKQETSVTLNNLDTVSQLKQDLARVSDFGHPTVESQRVVFKGVLLSNTSNLYDIGAAGQTLHLALSAVAMASMAGENGGRQIGSRIGAGVATASDALETANTPSKLTACRDGAGDRDEHTHLLHRPRYAPSTPIPSADRDQKPRLTARRMTTAGVTAAESTGSVANLLAKDGEQDDTEGASMVQTVQSDDEFAALMGCGSHGDENGNNAASSYNGEEPVVVVDFTASWSLPCRQIAPFFEGIAQRYATTGRARFVKVDVDELPTAAEECRVSSMPTFQVFHRGVKLGETCGASKSSLEALVRRYCV